MPITTDSYAFSGNQTASQPSGKDISVKPGEVFTINEFLNFANNTFNTTRGNFDEVINSGFKDVGKSIITGLSVSPQILASRLTTGIIYLPFPTYFLNESDYSEKEIKFFDDFGIVALIGGEQVPDGADFLFKGKDEANAADFRLPEKFIDLPSVDSLTFSISIDEIIENIDDTSKPYTDKVYLLEAGYRTETLTEELVKDMGFKLESTYSPENALLKFGIAFSTRRDSDFADLGKHYGITVDVPIIVDIPSTFFDYYLW